MFMLGWALALTIVSGGVYAVTQAGTPTTNSSANDGIAWGQIAFGVALLLVALRTWRNQPVGGLWDELPGGFVDRGVRLAVEAVWRAPLGSPVGSAAFAETTDLDLGAAVLHRAPLAAVVAAEVEKQPGAIGALAQLVVPVGEDQLRGGMS